MPARSKPSPSPTPLIAWIEHSAPAIRPSRRSSQETCEPSPGTSPKAMTSKTPPIDSLALRWTLMWPTIARLDSRSRQRTGIVVDALEVGDRQRLGALRRAHAADLDDVRADLDADRAQERPRQRAAGDARRRLAGAGALEHVAHVGEVVLLRADEVGVAGPRQMDLGHRRPRPATGSSAPPSWRSRGWRSAARSGRPASGRGARRAVTSARSRSIFIRPPRPWPSWRRAMSRLSSVLVEGQPGGQALDDAGEAGAVRLPGGDEAQRHGAAESMSRLPRGVLARRRRRPRAAARCARRSARVRSAAAVAASAAHHAQRRRGRRHGRRRARRGRAAALVADRADRLRRAGVKCALAAVAAAHA